MLERRDRKVLDQYREGGSERLRIESAMDRPTVFDCFLRYLSRTGYAVPGDVLYRNVSLPLQPSPGVQSVVRRAHHDGREAAQTVEGLLALDERLQEWRTRHGRMVQRILGDKRGTGGTTGASYLRTTMSVPTFPDLWAVRSEL